ncbi:MAG: hypothetical protein ACLGGX_05425 [Bdellovibrionia bacterium]
MISLLYRLLKPNTYKLIPAARKYNFIDHSISLEQRFQRQKPNWHAHLEKTQNLYNDFFTKFPKARSLTIVGSAHLHEYPKDELLKRFEKIVLVDAIHPPHIVSWAKKHKKVELIAFDITGVLDRLEQIFNYDDLLEACAGVSPLKISTDLLVSANILSQLHLTPMTIVEKNNQETFTLEQKDKLATTSAETHLKWLENQNIPCLVYTDREVTYRNSRNEITYRGSYPVNFNSFQKLDEWTWLLAPLNEISPLYSVEMKEEAYFFMPTNKPS